MRQEVTPYLLEGGLLRGQDHCLCGLAAALERIWSGISPAEAPSEEQAARIAEDELTAVRAERSARRVN